MNKKKNNLDEMQEQKLLKIEHYGFWLAFWGLAAAIILQAIMAKDVRNISTELAGESLVFLLISIYTLVACLVNGIWDRRMKPNSKTNFLLSLLTATISGIVFFVSSFYKYGKLVGAIATGIFMFIEIFVLCFAALTFFVYIYKKRVKKLEAEVDETSGDSEIK